jgi:CspA family cold shock protein
MAETGTVKWFDGKKGYGFLTRSDGEKDVFFHATDLRKSEIEDEDVDEGQRFSFEIAQTPRGVKAVKLSRVEAAAVPEADGNAAPVEQVVADATIPVPEDDGNIR